MNDLRLAVPYHAQETGSFCGAAAAMMVLQWAGAALPNLSQTELFASGFKLSNSANWGITGDGLGLLMTQKLQTLLEDKKKQSWYNKQKYKDGPTTLTKAVKALNKGPVFLLVDGSHWVVLVGVEEDNGKAYVLVNWPEVSGECDGVPPHRGASCTGAQCAGYGVSCFEWEELLKHLVSDETVTVEPVRVVPATYEGAVGKCTDVEYGGSSVPIIIRSSDGSVRETEFAVAGTNRMLLRKGSVVARSVGGVGKGWIASAAAAEGVVRERLALGEEVPIKVSEQLFWTMCQESRSPMRPFWRVEVGAGDEESTVLEVFVRVDGEVAPRLTAVSPG